MTTAYEYAKNAYEERFDQHRNIYHDEGRTIFFSNVGENRESRTEAIRLRKEIEARSYHTRCEGPAFYNNYSWAIVVHDTGDLRFVQEAWEGVFIGMQCDGYVPCGQPVCWTSE